MRVRNDEPSFEGNKVSRCRGMYMLGTMTHDNVSLALEGFSLLLESWSGPDVVWPSTALLLLPPALGSLRRSIRRANVCSAGLFL